MSSGYRRHNIQFTGTTDLARKLIKKSISHWPLKEVTPDILRQMLDRGEFIWSQTRRTGSASTHDASQDGSTIKVIKAAPMVRKKRPVSDKISRSPSYQYKQKKIAEWRRLLGQFIGEGRRMTIAVIVLTVIRIQNPRLEALGLLGTCRLGRSYQSNSAGRAYRKGKISGWKEYCKLEYRRHGR